MIWSKFLSLNKTHTIELGKLIISKWIQQYPFNENIKTIGKITALLDWVQRKRGKLFFKVN